jgi:redox-sensitive bicupin YhaK (pirin superfamily)
MISTPRPTTLAADQVSEDRTASLLRLFPTLSLQHLDPFVVLDEFDLGPEVDAWPTHSPRGFEALTYMLDGAMEHSDEAGNTRRVEAGGAQVVVAPLAHDQVEAPVSGARKRGLKLLVNVSERMNGATTGVNQVASGGFPEASSPGVRVRTVAGDDSPLKLKTPVQYYDIALGPGASHEASIPVGWNGFAYVVDGQVQIGDANIGAGSAAFPGQGVFKIKSAGAARVVVIAGQPHSASAVS